MNRFVVLLTIAMILAHALFGCDEHHAHAEVRGDETQTGHGDHVHHKAAQHSPVSGQLPDHEECCCHLTCKWLLPDVVDDVAPELNWSPTVLSEDQLSDSQGSHSLLQAAAPVDALLALPVRIHLAMSVLLI